MTHRTIHGSVEADRSIPHWHDLTNAEAKDVVAQDPVLILPLAATEQHGPHLPPSTDVDIGLGLLSSAFRQLPDNFPAWVLPMQAVGASREHARFPETVSVTHEQLSQRIYETGSTVAACGVKRLLLANSHGGNPPAMAAAGLRLREEHNLLVVHANYFRFPRPVDVKLPATEWRHGFHGGAVETAMMLHLHPERVRLDTLPHNRSLGQDLAATLQFLSPEGSTASFSWLAGDLHPSGVTGDTRLADANMGQHLVTSYGTVLARIIEDAKAFPVERLV